MLMFSTVAINKFPKDPMCRFTNIQKQLLAPFIVYAEFESSLQRVGDEAIDSTQGLAVGGDEPTPVEHLKEHFPCNFAYKLVSSSVLPDACIPLVSYMGEDAGEVFVRKLQEEAKQLFQEYVDTPQQLLTLTEAELRAFHTAIKCHICN